MKVAVGIDGGGTRATAVAVDETGRELARSPGPAGIVETARIDEVVSRLVILVRAVLGQAGLTAPCDALVCALAGAGREPQRTQVELALTAAGTAGQVGIVTDAEAAFHDAFADDAGILLLAGTGSIAWGRGPGGERGRVGGWGGRIGDEGSAWAIGLAGLRAVARANDGRDPPTTLTDALLLEPGIDDPSALVRWAESARKKDVAALGPIVLRMAGTDAAARRIMEEAVAELVLHVECLAKRLGPWPQGTAVALAGGLLESGRPLRGPVCEAIADRLAGARVLDRDIDGARGAASLALARIR
jgi:glucosamine kinase